MGLRVLFYRTFLWAWVAFTPAVQESVEAASRQTQKDAESAELLRPKPQKPKIIDLSNRTSFNITDKEVINYIKAYEIESLKHVKSRKDLTKADTEQWNNIHKEIESSYTNAIAEMNEAFYKLEQAQNKWAIALAVLIPWGNIGSDIEKYTFEFNKAVGGLRELQRATKGTLLLELTVDYDRLQKLDWHLLDLRPNNTTLIDTKSGNYVR